jgi:hypothetical protein
MISKHSKSRARRLWRCNLERVARQFHRKRAEREEAISKASGEWLRIGEIVSDVAEKEGAKFDDNKRNKIAIEVCGRIVSDSSDGKLGTEQSPALMLLSRDYDETHLLPSELVQTLRIAFDGLSPKKQRRKIAGFLTDHGWMKRAVADQWLGSGDRAQSQDRSHYYELPTDEPPGGREAARAYHALKQKYGTKVPKRSTQWLATNLPGNHSRDSIARALGKKK